MEPSNNATALRTTRVGAVTIVLAAIVLAAVVLTVVVLASVVAGCGSRGATADVAASSSTSPSPQVTPLEVVACSPRRRTQGVAFSKTLAIRFSTALASDTPHPKLVPSVPGTWTVVRGATLVFHPAGHWPLLTTVHVIVSSGSKGVRGSTGGRLAATYVTSFTTGGASVLRLQQLLAELHYLPLRFRVRAAARAAAASASAESSSTAASSATSTATSTATSSAASTATSSATASVTPTATSTATPTATSSVTPTATSTATPHAARRLSSWLVSLTPARGVFVWRYRQMSVRLGSLWRRGQDTVLVRGAVMAFQADHGLTADGITGQSFWAALLRAVARRQVDKHPYDYIEVTTSLPETLLVWRDGRVVYSSAANTGIASRPTPHGTFAVYAHLVSTTMSGTNPDGSHYHDTGVPYVAYFNGGDAVHGFVRSSYGYPQSLGCVELPYSAAAVVFEYDPIGTLVTVR